MGEADETLRTRSADEVLDDHMRGRAARDLEGDLRRNYDENVRIFHVEGVGHGHEAVRHCDAALHQFLPDMRFTTHTKLVDGDVALLEWSARADGADARDGADSFVIRNGRIVAQTIHYRVVDSREDHSSGAGQASEA